MKVINRKKIEGTPFEVCQVESDNNYVITIGNAVLSEKYKEEETAIKAVNEKDWQIIFNAICYILWTNESRKEENNA